VDVKAPLLIIDYQTPRRPARRLESAETVRILRDLRSIFIGVLIVSVLFLFFCALVIIALIG
jgi:hypothetical protein